MTGAVGGKIVAAMVTTDVAAIVAVVTTLADEGGSSAGNAVLGAALTAAVASLGYVLRAMLTGRLVPQNVAETVRRLDELGRSVDRLETKLDTVLDRHPPDR